MGSQSFWNFQIPNFLIGPEIVFFLNFYKKNSKKQDSLLWFKK